MKYTYWLAALEGVSHRKKWQLDQTLGSAKAVYEMKETQLKALGILTPEEIDKLLAGKENWDLDREWGKLAEQGIRFLYRKDPAFPKSLQLIPDPPYALFVKGSLPEEGVPSVAMVGSRTCTPYGETQAHRFAKILAEAGVTLISGMARGIDGASHRGALDGGGKTFAVLGNGVDICYPREHAGLYRDILKNGGGMISEVGPGSPPLSWHFPRRNRIISGLTDLVLVIEAGRKSGSLITADMALEQGKDVYALPGPVDSALSEGCHLLIREGAGILISPELILTDLGLTQTKALTPAWKQEKGLERKENMVYSSVCLFPRSLSEIADDSSLSSQEVLGILTSLEMKGYIRECAIHEYVRKQ